MSHERAIVIFEDGTRMFAEFNASVGDYCIGCLPQLYLTDEEREAEWHWTWAERSVQHVCTAACPLERTEYHVFDMIFDDVMVCREHRWIVDPPRTPDGDPAPERGAPLWALYRKDGPA